MDSETINYTSRSLAAELPASAIPAADDRTVVRIREALRDRQAAQLAGEVRT